jgi:hypothetical protein
MESNLDFVSNELKEYGLIVEEEWEVYEVFWRRFVCKRRSLSLILLISGQQLVESTRWWWWSTRRF